MSTQITEPMSMAVAALDAMDNHAALVREVAVRLLSEHATGLPELIAIHMEAGVAGPRLALQPGTAEGAALWAQALGVTLTEEFSGDRDGWRRLRGSIDVDGVRVHVGAFWRVPTSAADAGGETQ